MNSRLRAALPVVLMLLAFAGIPIAILAFNSWEHRRDFLQALDDFAAATGVRTIEDLRPAPVPDDENAAIVYRQAFVALDAANLSDAEEDIVFEALERDDIEAVRPILERARPAINLALNAAAMERCDWQTTIYEEGKDALLPHLRPLQVLVRLLLADACVSIRSGDEARARTLLTASLGVRDHLFNEHTLISFMAALSVESRVLILMSRTWDRWSDSGVKTLRDRIHAPSLRNIYQRTLPLEALVGLQFFEDPDEVEFVGPGGQHRPDFSNWNNWRDRTLYLDRMRELFKAALGDHAERIRPIEDNPLPPWAALSGQLVPSHKAYSVQVAHAELGRTILDAAINIEVERRSSGRYPQSMPAIEWTESSVDVEYEATEGGSGYRFVIKGNRIPRVWTWQVGEWPSESNGDDGDALSP